MFLLEFSIAPLEKGESVGEYVARSLAIIDGSRLDYRLHAMGTIVEGEIDEVLAVLKRCLEAMAADCDRITCTAKLDYRRGHRGRLETKVSSVEQQLGKKLKTVATPAGEDRRRKPTPNELNRRKQREQRK